VIGLGNGDELLSEVAAKAKEKVDVLKKQSSVTLCTRYVK
jgi:hypothetical protein